MKGEAIMNTNTFVNMNDTNKKVKNLHLQCSKSVEMSERRTMNHFFIF